IDNSEFHSNMDLSAERAINVRSLLVNSENGLDPEKTSIEAWGELKPKASNDTEQGRAQNRRVEIVVSREYKEADTASK
ncbi:OmpA family protein, partial [Vibrio parahaemolyticus]|nr:OmpA family protein [Vibrio parahaemolyticus]